VPDARRGREEPQAPAPPRFTGPAEYRILHKYLRDRFADTVVLTFAQIEDLLGCALPDVARLRLDWWATTDEAPSAQSRTWTQASRTAVPNLLARTVMFDRVSV
jgi:hypothetical protein